MNRPPAPFDHWPPIIADGRLSVLIRLRDIGLAVLGWLIVQDLLLDLWVLLYDWLKDPIFILAPEDTPDWEAIFQKIDPFLITAGLLMASIVVTALLRVRAIRRAIHNTLPEVDETAAARFTGEAAIDHGPVSALRQLRMADVHVSPDGRIERFSDATAVAASDPQEPSARTDCSEVKSL